MGYKLKTAPPAANLFAGKKNESQRGGGIIEMHNIYPCALLTSQLHYLQKKINISKQHSYLNLSPGPFVFLTNTLSFAYTLMRSKMYIVYGIFFNKCILYQMLKLWLQISNYNHTPKFTAGAYILQKKKGIHPSPPPFLSEINLLSQGVILSGGILPYFSHMFKQKT